MKQLNLLLAKIVVATIFIIISSYRFHQSNLIDSWSQLIRANLLANHIPVDKTFNSTVVQTNGFKADSNSPSLTTIKTPQIVSTKDNIIEAMHHSEEFKSNIRARMHQTDTSVILSSNNILTTPTNSVQNNYIALSGKHLKVYKYMNKLPLSINPNIFSLVFM